MAVPTGPRLQCARGYKSLAAASDMQQPPAEREIGSPCRFLPQGACGGVQRRAEVGLVGSVTSR